jgi:hypothetical protein
LSEWAKRKTNEEDLLNADVENSENIATQKKTGKCA